MSTLDRALLLNYFQIFMTFNLCCYILQHWLVSSKPHRLFFTERGSIGFANLKPPLDENNNAYCKVRLRLH